MNNPINGFIGNFIAIMAFVGALVPLFTDLTIWVTVICSVVLLSRLYSFFRYEKKLPL